MICLMRASSASEAVLSMAGVGALNPLAFAVLALEYDTSAGVRGFAAGYLARRGLDDRRMHALHLDVPVVHVFKLS